MERYGKRIRYQKVAPGVGPVENEEITKGYEYEKGKYVLIDQQEIDDLKLESKQTIELVRFVDEDAIDTARLCARREGVNAGISAGAAVWAAVQVGARPEMRGKRIVAILPDSGDRYISTPFFAP